jgi:hypothetical protein
MLRLREALPANHIFTKQKKKKNTVKIQMTANAGVFGKMASPLNSRQLAYSPRQNDDVFLRYPAPSWEIFLHSP